MYPSIYICMKERAGPGSHLFVFSQFGAVIMAVFLRTAGVEVSGGNMTWG